MAIRRYSIGLTGALLLGVASLGGCSSDATFYYGQSIGGLQLSLSDPDEGIYPSLSALADPNNPFAHSTMGDQTKWNVQSSNEPVAAFYAWATVNARQPYGESQYYVAFNLKATYLAGAAAVDDLPAIRAQAIRAFQTVLDYFPDAVTYDATGKIPYDLATPSYQAIIDLGGTVAGGWVLLQTSDGHARAVKP
jgi:hypothetical protein